MAQSCWSIHEKSDYSPDSSYYVRVHCESRITFLLQTLVLHVCCMYVYCISCPESFPSECHLRGCSNKWRNFSRIKVHNLVIQGVMGIYPPSHAPAGWAAEPHRSAPSFAEYQMGQKVEVSWRNDGSWRFQYIYIYIYYMYIYVLKCVQCGYIHVYTKYNTICLCNRYR